MRDERWERDTLFLVFEEDFRFTEHEDPEPVMVKAGRLQEVVGEMPEDEADQPRVPLDASNTVTGPGLHMKKQTVQLTAIAVFRVPVCSPSYSMCFPGCLMECTGVYS